MKKNELTQQEREIRKQCFEAMVQTKGLEAARKYFGNPKNNALINSFVKTQLAQRLAK